MTAIGIIGATTDELRMFGAHPLPAGVPRQIGPALWVIRAGLGARRAEIAAARLLAAAGPLPLLSWGTAGALSPALQAGDVLLPECIIDALGGRAFETDARWRAAVAALGQGAYRLHHGPLLQVDHILCDPERKQALHAHHAADGVDMESAALAELAQRRGLPFLALRVVVDTAAQRLPAAAGEAVSGDGTAHPGRLVSALARRPRELPAMLQLVRSFARARRTLNALAKHAREGRLAPPSGIDATADAAPLPAAH